MRTKLTKFLGVATLVTMSAVAATAQSNITSGEYGSLVLGVDSKGRLTGYFHETTGTDDRGNPRFTCSFLLQADKAAGNEISVMTWHPNAPAEPKFGKLFRTDEGVMLKLDEAHGGCGNVAPDIANDGQAFELTKRGGLIAAGMIRSAKAFFHTTMNVASRGKAFVVRGDRVTVTRRQGSWVEIAFTNEAGRTTRGWVKQADLYPDEPF
jgi:hypothetical protein